MTNGKQCECKWDGDKVIAECEAHFAFFKEQMQPLIEAKAKLEYIEVYAKNDHPLLSSKPCPLCRWDSGIKDGMWVGAHREFCSYHYALNQLYALKIEGQEDIWHDEN